MIVCFIGHRTVENVEQLKRQINSTVLRLIQDGADTFLFGSKSKFDSICWKIVTELQRIYTNIKRIYVRATYPTIQKHYKEYLLESYEGTYFPERMETAGRSTYVKRNQNMIGASNICVFYYNPDYKLLPKMQKSSLPLPTKEIKSGTAIAFAYATRKKKRIINLYKD